MRERPQSSRIGVTLTTVSAAVTACALSQQSGRPRLWLCRLLILPKAPGMAPVPRFGEANCMGG